MSTNPRTVELAKIHIARKDLQLDDETYRAIIRDVGGAKTGSSGDLTATGRARILAHFQTKGWKPKRGRRPAAAKHSNMVSDAQIKMIRGIWIRLADAGVIKARDEAGLRAWIRSATRHKHPAKAGYNAVEFLPKYVASDVIEQLKKWAGRCRVSIDPDDPDYLPQMDGPDDE